MNSLSILVAEEQKLSRQLLISVLNNYGMQITGEAENGSQLMELLGATNPDILLLDIALPYLQGHVFRELSICYPCLKIIVMGHHPEELLSDYFYLNGAKAFITKDDSLDRTIHTICAVHENTYTPEKTSFSKEYVRFSKREADLIPLMIEGKSNKEIADCLKIGNKAVEAHKKNIFKKTNTQSSLAFVIFALKQGFNYLK
jgi:DNA-binding NarL/FixJ family response regulator